MTDAAIATKPAIRPSIQQTHAIELCCDMSETIVGVTGGAGTGKTFVLGRAHEELTAMKKKIVLAAPTGRAAKRIEELTGIKAKTVHRMLEFPQPDEYSDEPNEPRRHLRRPLDEQVVFIDESSMLSPTLYRQIMNALPPNGVVRFFGDNNQLPPVEEGKPPFIQVLKKYPMVELMYNYRSDDAIVANAQRILRGLIPQRNNRFQIFYSDNPMKYMLDLVKGETVFTEDTHQIIIPARKGKHGTQRINPFLQTRFNPRGEMLYLVRFDDSEDPLGVRAGDKFLWIKNDYNLEMFNGEIGTISGLDADSGELSLQMGGRSVLVPPRLKTFSPWHGTTIDYDPRKQIELGYAITTHKAQGSEFDTVIYCISRAMPFLLNRRNLYTAVTRAKTQVIIIADTRAMSLSMKPAAV